MAEKKRRMNLLGHDTEVTEVDIVAKDERMAEYKLEDGSIIRFIAYPTSVVRVDGQYNADGMPIYIVLNSPITAVISSPDHLKRK